MALITGIGSNFNTLAAGTNINIFSAGGTATISATGGAAAFPASSVGTFTAVKNNYYVVANTHGSCTLPSKASSTIFDVFEVSTSSYTTSTTDLTFHCPANVVIVVGGQIVTTMNVSSGVFMRMRFIAIDGVGDYVWTPEIFSCAMGGSTYISVG